MKTTEIIDLLTKMMNEADNKAEEYSNHNPHSHAWYAGQAAALAEAINQIIRKEYP